MTKELPRIIRSLSRPLRHAAKRIIYYGTNIFCPVCGGSGRAFEHFGIPSRRNARCPSCGSLERHRFLWRYLERRTTFFESAGAAMLHIAAEPCLERRFRRIIGPGYVTADLLNLADVRMDITNIQYQDDSFDIVCCSHVLEHVPDDHKAMREIRRVLKRDGWALLMVPITRQLTVEDASVTDPEDRRRLFGQADHVRRYGHDFADRLRQVGFAVDTVRAEEVFTADEITRFALGGPGRAVFHCTKAPAF